MRGVEWSRGEQQQKMSTEKTTSTEKISSHQPHNKRDAQALSYAHSVSKHNKQQKNSWKFANNNGAIVLYDLQVHATCFEQIKNSWS